MTLRVNLSMYQLKLLWQTLMQLIIIKYVFELSIILDDPEYNMFKIWIFPEKLTEHISSKFLFSFEDSTVMQPEILLNGQGL